METALLGTTAVAGALTAWSLAAPPGPINALMAHAAARRGFWRGWVYGLGAIAGDMVMFALTGFGVLRVVEAVPGLKVAFAFLGAGLMGWFAWGAWRAARAGTGRGLDGEERPPPAGREFAKAFVIVATSPYNWAWWLTAGTSMLALLGFASMFGFFAGLFTWTLVWTGLAAAGGRRIRRLADLVAYAAALVLAVFAVVLAGYGATLLV